MKLRGRILAVARPDTLPLRLLRNRLPCIRAAAGVLILLGGLACGQRGAATAAEVPAGVPTVAVGDRYLNFTATDSTGADFTLSSLAGRPILLKFFRGHW